MYVTASASVKAGVHLRIPRSHNPTISLLRASNWEWPPGLFGERETS